jgi:hypothetical protein
MDTSKNGLPNLTNEKVLASFLDLIGSTLTLVLHEVRDEGLLTPEGATDLCKVHSILARMRDMCGVNTDWHRDNLALDTLKYFEQMESKERPSPAEVAEQILRDL